VRLADALYTGRRLAALWRSQYWDSARIAEYQSDRLVQILRYALERVPFYRNLGIDPACIRDASDLIRFPVLTKKHVQDNGDAFLADGFNRSMLYQSRTSGSTGEPSATYFDRHCWLTNKYALKYRRTIACNHSLFGRILIVGEDPPAKNGNSRSLPILSHIVSARRVSIHDSIESHAELITRYRPTSIYGFPSWFRELLDYLDGRDMDIRTVSTVFTSSEVLARTLRTRIESRFNTRVHDIYGSTEFKEVAWECANRRYHLNFESTFIETESKPAALDSAALLLTSLNNHGMPLIRYRLGDLGNIGHGPCSCGRQSPYIENITGREVDMFELQNGRRVSPYMLTTAIEAQPEIRKYQLIQLSPGFLRIRYVVKDGGSPARVEQFVTDALTRHFGQELTASFEKTDDIHRSKSGKQHVLIRPSNNSHL
jgi:phenylacetate-CoA ligase